MADFQMNIPLFHRLRRSFLTGLAIVVGFSFVHAEENEVIVISPHWDGIQAETSRAFSEWHRKKYGSPATIHWRQTSGGASQIVRFLKSEYAAGPSAGIDVLYGGGVDPFLDFKKAGLLTPYNPPTEILDNIPAQLNGMQIYDPDHEWFGAALSGFGIITNERAREAVGLPAVHTWEDLTDPGLFNWIASTDPRASGSALAIDEIILQAYGWDKGWAVLMEMSGNTRNFLASSASAAVEVGVGDAAYGVAIDVYGQAQAGFYGSKNVSFVLPEGQTVITPDSIAILRNPPHPEMAQRFMEFVLSRTGQLLWMMPKGSPGGATRYTINRMSVWPSLYTELAGVTPVTTDPFTMHSDFVYNNKLGTQRRAILSVMIGAWMIDTHDVMARAWEALNSTKAQKLAPERKAELLAEFVAAPCSEKELLHLADTDFKDPIKRTALVNQWQNDALVRYKRLLAQIAAN
jgi:ABC-type Fe3+ transport system substrate-binding protein